jgi:hypothetical protein
MVLHVVSMSLYLAIAAVLVVFAVIYLFRSTAMSYHLVAMGKRWDEIEQGTQVILLALMRTAGAGFLTVSAAGVCLVMGGLSCRLAWANGALLVMYFALFLPLTAVTRGVRRRTSGRPPMSAAIIGTALAVVAFLCEWLA